MKITIFETEHYEGAFPVIKLFNNPENKISIITNQASFEKFEELFNSKTKQFNWTIIGNLNPKSIFFYRFYKTILKNKPAVLYLNTISNNHLLYAILLTLIPKTQIIVTVHDINCLFKTEFRFNFRLLIKHIGKRLLIKKADAFNVVSDTMIDYIKSKTHKPIFNIPGAVFESETYWKPIEHMIKLVVPGSIDHKRRDYKQVIQLLGLAEERHLPLHISLAGGYSSGYGKGIIHYFKNTKYHYASVQFYDATIISQQEFDNEIRSSHFVFIPSVINTFICDDIPETYGITKSSGNIYDVIKNAKPFIAPENLKISENIQSSCFKYSSINQIIEFAENLLKNTKDYEKWFENAKLNSSNYTIQKIRNNNPLLFNLQQS